MNKFKQSILAIALVGMAASAFAFSTDGGDITFGPKSGGDREVYIVNLCPDASDPCTVPDPSTSLKKLRKAKKAGANCHVTVETNKNMKITKVTLGKGCN